MLCLTLCREGATFPSPLSSSCPDTQLQTEIMDRAKKKKITYTLSSKKIKPSQTAKPIKTFFKMVKIGIRRSCDPFRPHQAAPAWCQHRSNTGTHKGTSQADRNPCPQWNPSGCGEQGVTALGYLFQLITIKHQI